MIVPFTYRAWYTVPFCIIVNISFPLLWLYISFLMKYIVIKKALYDYLSLKKQHMCNETTCTFSSASYHIVSYYIVYCIIQNSSVHAKC